MTLEESLIQAEYGDNDVQYNIGMMYLMGEKVERHKQIACYWLLKAAKQGHSKAQYMIGRMVGLGFYSEKGLGQKHTHSDLFDESLFNFTSIHRFHQREEEAFEWYLKAAKQGVPEALSQVADAYYTGNWAVGNKKDLEKAFLYYKQAAELGLMSAQYCLAGMYNRGEGVEKNEIIALVWYRKVAERNKMPISLEEMALVEPEERREALFRRRKEVDEKSDEYHNSILQQGAGCLNATFLKYKASLNVENKILYYFLGEMYYHGIVVERDFDKAFECYMFVGYRGFSKEAQYAIGRMYERGECAKQNLETAINWYCKAAEQNCVEAMQALKRLGVPTVKMQKKGEKRQPLQKRNKWSKIIKKIMEKHLIWLM